MPAYLIADVEITDPALYEQYRQGVPATIAAHGGRYLTRGGEVRVMEGEFRPKRFVLIEFPSLQALQAWYDSPEYKPLLELRQRAARSNIVFADGLPPA